MLFKQYFARAHTFLYTCIFKSDAEEGRGLT